HHDVRRRAYDFVALDAPRRQLARLEVSREQRVVFHLRRDDGIRLELRRADAVQWKRQDLGVARPSKRDDQSDASYDHRRRRSANPRKHESPFRRSPRWCRRTVIGRVAHGPTLDLRLAEWRRIGALLGDGDPEAGEKWDPA